MNDCWSMEWLSGCLLCVSILNCLPFCDDDSVQDQNLAERRKKKQRIFQPPFGMFVDGERDVVEMVKEDRCGLKIDVFVMILDRFVVLERRSNWGKEGIEDGGAKTSLFPKTFFEVGENWRSESLRVVCGGMRGDGVDLAY
eukprot:TRINITY_DN1816_c0_g1_i1.p2 TRINITY_DN1816_c0_g1~~TRINITY_DN1816_c0_g1_i1.p2  ORF type:complete len:141 (-),score=7.23 TRINITY_DN1816_c0_g1_i1:514-936(-)